MATEVKLGGKNDSYALKEACSHNRTAAINAEKALAELQRMQTQVGRPDYSRIAPILSQLTISLSRTNTALEDMRSIRVQAGVWEESEELEERVMQLEAQLAGLMERFGGIGVTIQ